ncbi:DUF2530 domain-containing protein [Amycolatopsis nigrescens]|uniref:DUF2530 domain-containing protein n=1 Tax=Amycolatopsis nigrescens TaxID=381445 RepID=UPI00037726A3|nr:DUF2530 domain-containing protein [Amycolatopsis nigrescens]
MGEPINAGEVKGPLRPVPELPQRLIDIWPVVIVGTGLWLVGFVVTLVSYLSSDGPPSVAFWTTVAGLVISFLGMGVMTWQSTAARRGSRTAQRGI